MKAPRDTDIPDGVQAIRILEDLRLKRERRDTGGKTMRFNGMSDCLDIAFDPLQVLQKPRCLFSGQPRGRRSLRQRLGDLHAIMQQGRRRQYGSVAPLLRHDPFDSALDTQEMPDIMSAIHSGVDAGRRQVLRKLLMRRKPSGNRPHTTILTSVTSASTSWQAASTRRSRCVCT